MKFSPFTTFLFYLFTPDGHSVSSLEEIVVSAGYHVLSRPGRISGPSLELLKIILYKYSKLNSTFFFTNPNDF